MGANLYSTFGRADAGRAKKGHARDGAEEDGPTATEPWIIIDRSLACQILHLRDIGFTK